MAEGKILKSQAISNFNSENTDTTPENLCFYTPWKQQKTSDVVGVFMGYRTRTLAKNGLKPHWKQNILV